MDFYRGRRVLITGAAGSIGSELARQIARFQPEMLLLFDRDENGLIETSMEVRHHFFGPVIELPGDIRDRGRLDRLVTYHRPDTILHAAAYKHVTLTELHPDEAVANNVIGSRHVIEVAETRAVENLVLISTDKAVQPVSILGATKRLAEKMLLERAGHSNTYMNCVRFGNVLESRASLLPILRSQIARSRKITLTDPDAERFFMTLDEAVRLLLQAASLKFRGGLFVLDMGNPVRILDLVREFLKSEGLKEGEDVELEVIGLRPGERLSESILDREEKDRMEATPFRRVFVIPPPHPVPAELWGKVAILEEAAGLGDTTRVRSILQALDLDYVPAEAISDTPRSQAE